MASKKSIEDAAVEVLSKDFDKRQTYNPLLVALRDNDKKNLFRTNVTTAFIKTGYPLYDYYFGAVVNMHDENGKLIGQEARVGQAAGTFNLIIGNSGSGKSLPLVSRIYTETGWKKMGDLTLSDKVMSIDGTFCDILGIYPQGELSVWEIHAAGKVIRCSGEHLWTVHIPKGPNCFVEETMSTEDLHRHIKINLIDYYIPRMNDNNREEIEWVKIDDIVHKENEFVPMQCIFVNHPSHLYLMEDMFLTHNTTLGAQVAANIIRQYQFANAIHIDCEQRFDVSRCETITQLPASFFDSAKGERYMIKSGSCGLDTIQEMIVKLYVQKMKLKDELTVPSGFKDEFGRDVMILQPTVILIDSITTVLNETFNPESAKEAHDAEGLRTNTEGARDAKTLKGFFKDVIPLCKDANIIMYGINHINANMSMNAFIPVAKQQNFLKQDESIPGGRTMIYYPFNIVKLTAKPSDDFTEDVDGFAGHMVMVEPIKSSSNQSGNNSKGVSFELVFCHKTGFDNLRSMVMYGRDHGLIEGNKARMKFRDDPECTFSWRNLHEEVKNKPIWENIKKYIIPTLDQHLPFIEPEANEFDVRSLDY